MSHWKIITFWNIIWVKSDSKSCDAENGIMCMKDRVYLAKHYSGLTIVGYYFIYGAPPYYLALAFRENLYYFFSVDILQKNVTYG